MSNKQVILYGYPMSPHTAKVSSVLALKKIPFKLVEVSPQPPRPELERLGITYRRIPILAIGGDVLCDSALIIQQLESRFTPEDGFPSLFPEPVSSFAPFLSSIAYSYIDKGFEGMLALLPLALWQNEKLKKDREEYFGRELRLEAIQSQLPIGMFNLKQRLELIENQLKTVSQSANDREVFFLKTQAPSILDVYYHFQLSWIKNLCQRIEPDSKVCDFFDSLNEKYPLTSEWIQRLETRIESSRQGQTSLKDDPIGGIKIQGDEAHEIISNAEKSSDLAFDLEDELVRIKKGENVQVVPIDTGKVPQVGKLVGLSSSSSTLLVVTSDGREIHVSFPRQGYSITKM